MSRSDERKKALRVTAYSRLKLERERTGVSQLTRSSVPGLCSNGSGDPVTFQVSCLRSRL